MKFTGKIMFIVYIMIIFTMLGLTACSNKTQKIDNTNMIFKINNSSETNGRIVSPWLETSFATNLIFRSLFIVDPETFEIKLDLADYYKISQDGLTYDVLLKNNLPWSDGEIINVEDVIFSIEMALLANDVNSMFVDAFKNIEGAIEFIESIDENENENINSISGIKSTVNKLTITLKSQDSNFAYLLSQFAILPKHIIKNENIETFVKESDYWVNPIVSGMYKPEENLDTINNTELEETKGVTYVYNDMYVGKKPNITTLLINHDFQPSEQDFFYTNDFYTIQEYREISHLTEYQIDNLFYRYFIFNINKNGQIDPVMNDVRVRQALTYAIDRNKLLKDIYNDTGKVINTGVVMECYKPLEKQYEYDPAIAKLLLEEAEYDFDRPIVLLYYYPDEISARFMKEVGEYLEDIGLKVEIVFGGNIYSSEYDYYDIALKGLSTFDINNWYEEYQLSNNMHKNVFGGEMIFDEIVENLKIAKNNEEKIEILAELQELEFDLIYKYPLFSMYYMCYLNELRVTIPDGTILANPNYRYDIGFENWIILSS